MRQVQFLDKDPFWSETLNIPAAGVTRLNAVHRENSVAVFVTVEDNNIRYWINGDNPNAAAGHLVYATGNFYVVSVKAVREFRAIAIGGAAVAQVTYYR